MGLCGYLWERPRERDVVERDDREGQYVGLGARLERKHVLR